MATIDQNGNAFATAMNIGTTDVQDVNIITNGTTKMTVDSSGQVGIGVTTPTTFNASATLFPSLEPKVEILTGTATNVDYNEAMVIRHSASGSDVKNRNVGIIFKLSHETTAAESTKSGAIMMGSINAFANAPTMNFYLGHDANPKLSILYSGTVNMKGGLQFNKQTNNSSAAISWYSPNYKGWTTYMAQAGTTGNGVKGNITAPTGTIVTTWALRNFIENNPTYGFTWETGTSTGNPTATIMELEANTGNFRLSSLAGTGTRMVTADSTGVLSANTVIDSDTYTPAILLTSGGTFTPNDFTYTRINDIVTVNGSIPCNLTTTGQNQIIIDLPYPITVTNTSQINGTVSGANVSGATASNEGAHVTAYLGLNGAAINFYAVDNIAIVYATFTYKV